MLGPPALWVFVAETPNRSIAKPQVTPGGVLSRVLLGEGKLDQPKLRAGGLSSPEGCHHMVLRKVKQSGCELEILRPAGDEVERVIRGT